MTRRHRKDAPSPRRRLLRAALGVVAWLVLVLTLAVFAMGEFGHRVWWMELFSHFRPHMLLAVGLCVALFLCARHRVGVIVSGVTLVIGAASVAPWFIPIGGAKATGERLRLCVSNVLTGNTRFEETLDGIYELSPDLAILIEVNDPRVETIRADPRWRIEFAETRWYSGWIIVIARADSPERIESVRSVTLTPGTNNIPALDIQMSLDGGPLRLLGVHARSPVTETNAANRNAQLDAIAEWVEEADAPTVVAGDLNTTVWSPRYRELARRTGLLNAMRGRGLVGTWHSAAPGPLRIGIDHVLYDDALVSLSRRVGDAGGSDHAPVLVELAWRDD